MYLIEYQKRNGDIFYRTRNSIPACGVGNYTSMGWKVLNYKLYLNGKYYSPSEYYRLSSKQTRYNRKVKCLTRFIKRNLSYLLTLIFALLYLFK